METNAGIGLMEDALIGVGGLVLLTNLNARIGVGDGNGSVPTPTATDTNLTATTNKWFQAMAASYPSRAGQTVTFQAVYGTSTANFPWNEWGIDNGGAGAGTSSNAVGPVLFNHKGVSLGTKASGSTWTFTVTITQS